MKIVVAAWGTTGDVYPLLAVVERLLRRGHEVRVCAPALYKERIQHIGADYREVGIAFELKQFHKAMDDIIPMRDALSPLLVIVKEGILRGGEKWYHDCLSAMKGYELALCHSGDIPGQEAAIRLGLPWVTHSYCPGFVPTRFSAPYMFPDCGTFLNASLWKLVEFRLTRAVDAYFNNFITAVGGEPRRNFALNGIYSPKLNLIAASPTLCPPPDDFPEKHEFTGVWFLDEPAYTPPSALLDFLANGPPPIIVSFGSMGGSNAKETTELLIAAIKKTGQRAIIQSGWGQLGLDAEVQDIFFSDYVPHRWLFPQASCIVHHGGAGTTASACRAKLPSVVVPHHADQFYWAKRLVKLGIAPKCLPRRSMTPSRLAKRIESALADTSMTERAQALGEKLNAEDGLTTAVELIEASVV